MSDNDQELFKRQAAELAVQQVRPGMIIGLGTGTTAIHVTRCIGEMVGAGNLPGLLCFATSRSVWDEAVRLGIPMLTEDMPKPIDLTIDGADEIDPDLNLIKGGGGALLREKIAAQASSRVIIVADESKLSSTLGLRFPVPVEVLPFGWQSQARFLTSLGADVSVRRRAGGEQFRTDQDNMILDCRFGGIADPSVLAKQMAERAGIVEHGMFLTIADEAIVAGRSGTRHLRRGGPIR
jgi:ribose 5-phosphate isomerase A